MKKIITYTALLIACVLQVTAQQNCSNPLNVTLCPSTNLTGQTNSGMINDYTSSCNLAGEDFVYKMTTRPGSTRIYICFSSVSALMRATLTPNCAYTGCSYLGIIGSATITFSVTGNTTYYLWIDASATVTYDVSFGNDTSNTFVNIPNTQGNLNFESSLCAAPPFKSTKPFLQVSYNGVYQTDPMTLAPLNVAGTLCVVNYFKNTTGIEGIKRFDFYSNPLGFSNFTPSPMSFPGFYNAGTWTATWSVNKWVFTFADLAGTGKGDFTGAPNSCLRYEFCFDVTPISNDPVKTNVKDSAFSDGFGMGFSGIVRSGCCPGCFTNCLGGGGGGGGGGGHAFGAGFSDPGDLLPIVLLNFNAKPKNQYIEVNWTTASELNNDYFTIEKSPDALEWISANTTNGAGNSSIPLNYSYTDPKPFPGTSYYRLKQTDYDGATSYSDAVAVKLKKIVPLTVFPNPSHGDLIVSSPEELFRDETTKNMKFILSNLPGESIIIPFSEINGEIHLDLSAFAKGIYQLEIVQDDFKSHHRIVLQE
jgi:hypothetical protein